MTLLRFGALVLGCFALGVGCGGEGAPERSCGVRFADYDGRRLAASAPALAHPLPAVARKVKVTGLCRAGTSELAVLRGIPPSVALVRPRTETGRLLVFLAEDLPVTTAQHPLHRFLYADDRTPDMTRGRTCTQDRVTGTVAEISLTGLTVKTSIGPLPVRVEGATRIDAAAVDGVPRLKLGASVTVDALRCERRTLLVARRIRAA